LILKLSTPTNLKAVSSKTKKPPSFTWIVAFRKKKKKPLSAVKNNDDKANADNKIHHGKYAVRKSQLKCIIPVLH